MNTEIQDSKNLSRASEREIRQLVNNLSLNVMEVKMPGLATEQLHYHYFSQQLFFILSGEATIELNGTGKQILPNQSVYVPPRTLHKISNRRQEDLQFLLISEPHVRGDRIEILDFHEVDTQAVKRLNLEWLEKYFQVEPNDTIQLNNPKEELIDKGGYIFYARYNEEITGTASLIKVDNEVYELGKMAVTEKFQGRGIGSILIQHCLNVAVQRSIRKLILYSNTRLESAIHLYRKYGFLEVDLESGHYQRANIKMEKVM